VGTILKFDITKKVNSVITEKFDKLKKDEKPCFKLEWRDYVRESIECKGVCKTKNTMQKKVQNSDNTDKDLLDAFSKV